MRDTLVLRSVAWFFVLFILIGPTASASAQTAYTWTGGAGSSDWLAPQNWNPSTAFPGEPGSTTNADRGLFDTAGSSVSATDLNGFSLGAIATTGASGGLMTTNFSGNGALRLNGGYTIGAFTNVAAAAQNGRDLAVTTTNMSIAFGTAGNATTFYADAGRTLALVSQQIANLGGDVNKEGAGTLLLGGSAGVTSELGGVAVNVNAGTLAAHESLNNTSQINVASGATLQAGFVPGGSLSVSALVTFANDAHFQTVTDGSLVSQLQNAAVTKNADDTFRISLTGLSPSGTETHTPNGIIIQASSLTGFDPNGTYTPSSPGHFDVIGNGFTVTDWSVSVLNNSQVQLNSFTITPVPEASAAGIAVAGLVALAAVRRQSIRFRTPSGLSPL